MYLTTFGIKHMRESNVCIGIHAEQIHNCSTNIMSAVIMYKLAQKISRRKFLIDPWSLGADPLDAAIHCLLHSASQMVASGWMKWTSLSKSCSQGLRVPTRARNVVGADGIIGMSWSVTMWDNIHMCCDECTSFSTATWGRSSLKAIGSWSKLYWSLLWLR